VLYERLQQSRTFHRYLSECGFGYSTMGYVCDEAQRVTGADTWRVPAVSEVFPTEVNCAAGIALTCLHGLRSVFAVTG
jgi:hypothetical protein